MLDEVYFLSKVPDYLICPICLLVASEPIEHTGCESIYCQACVSTLKTCPTCRKATAVTDYKKLNRHLFCAYKELKMKCYNYPACTATFTVEGAAKHLTECVYAEVGCQNVGCNCRIQKVKMPDHILTCPHRIVNCEYCENALQACQLRYHHEEVCTKYPTPCTHCSITLPKDALTFHADNECPLKEIKCSIPGCDVHHLRKDMNIHLQDYALHHVEILLQLVKAKDEEIARFQRGGGRQSNTFSLFDTEDEVEDLGELFGNGGGGDY
jgi:hypothetical protein